MSLVVTRGGDAWEVAWEGERANALSVALVESLHDLLDEAVREMPTALVLRGGSAHFASGFDLHEVDRLSDAELVHRFLRIGMLLDRLSRVPFLTVAAVTGAAIGAGADLVAACDHRLALASATFAFPGSRFGVVLGTGRLATLVGGDRALGLVGGRRVPATEAGFVGVYDDEPALESALGSLVEGWSHTDPSARPGLLAAVRPDDADRSLALLARSVLAPGLGRRIRATVPRRTVGTGPSSLTSRSKESA